MTRSLFLFASICLCGISSLVSCSSSASSSDEEDDVCQIYYADPTIYSENGCYYLSGTRDDLPLGFAALKSTDLEHWTYAGVDSMLLVAGDSVFGSKGFWAPQLLKIGDRDYLLAYTANEYVALAQAPDLAQHFRQSRVCQIDSSANNIDPFIFIDDDGKSYLYHVRFDGGNFIWVAEFDLDQSTICPTTLVKCLENDQPWESTGRYGDAPIMEGPTVIKLDGTYYLFYSANDFRSIDYAVGYATAPTPMGPWTKNPANPIIHRSIVGENGSGHGDVFTDSEGRLRYVYHVHNSDSVVSPRRTRIVTLNLGKSLDSPLYDITVDSATIIKPMRKIH